MSFTLALMARLRRWKKANVQPASYQEITGLRVNKLKRLPGKRIRKDKPVAFQHDAGLNIDRR
jgi:hypothetical protein